MDASTIIKTLGGRSAVASATGSDPNTVLYWERRGRIPSRHWPALLNLADEAKVETITPVVLMSHQQVAA